MKDTRSTAVQIRVTGLVHGVFFRATMARVASDLGVRGWVRNQGDGSVAAFLEGGEAEVKKVLEWAHRGPPRARVDHVEIEQATPRNFHGFRIEG